MCVLNILCILDILHEFWTFGMCLRHYAQFGHSACVLDILHKVLDIMHMCF